MKVIIDDLAVEYDSRGSGSVVLFLHGWGNNLHSFDELKKKLEESYQVVSLDLPGFGESEFRANQWELDDYVNFIAKFCDKLNIKPFALIGHSFGGRIIIKGVYQGKLITERLVLIASAGLAKRKSFRSLIFMLIAKLGYLFLSIPPLNKYKDTIRKKLYKRLGSDYHTTGKLRKTFLNIIKENLTKETRGLNLPVLLIWGSNDTQTKIEEGIEMNKNIIGSHLEIIEGASHFVHKEFPEEVYNYIHEFLSR